MWFADTGLCKLLMQSRSKLVFAFALSPGSHPLSRPCMGPIPLGLYPYIHFLTPFALSAFVSLTFKAVVVAWDL